MQKINTFTLQPIKNKDPEYEAPMSRLLHDKKDSGVILEGVYLNYQFRTRDMYILFITEDIPFEEALHIYLLNSSFEVLDFAELSRPYTTGAIDNINIINENEIEFTFFNETQWWQINIFPKPIRKIYLMPSMLSNLYAIVKRKITFLGYRYFDIFEVKKRHTIT